MTTQPDSKALAPDEAKKLAITLDCCIDCGKVRWTLDGHCGHCGQRMARGVVFYPETALSEIHRAVVAAEREKLSDLIRDFENRQRLTDDPAVRQSLGLELQGLRRAYGLLALNNQADNQGEAG